MAAGDKGDEAIAPASRTSDAGATAAATHPDGNRTSSSNVFWLKVLVYGMAGVMAVMMLVIIGRVVYLVNKPKSPAVAQPEATTASRGSDLLPEAVRIALPAGAAIGAISLSEGRIAIHYIADGRREIAIHDIASGRLLNRIAIENAAAGSR